MLKPKAFMIISLALAGVFMLATIALAEPPLLVEGKKTIYQRVIVHPGAYKYSQPDSAQGDLFDPFTVLYIYNRETVNGNNWLLCSPNTVGRDKVWVREDRTSQWNRALVLLLAGATERKPILFFKDKESLQKIAESDPVNVTVETIEKQIREYERTGSAPPPDFPVVAIEPDFSSGTVPTDSFYLMPIFNYDNTTFDNLLLLEVASIRPGEEGAQGASSINFGRAVMTGSYQRPPVESWATKAEGAALMAENEAKKAVSNRPMAGAGRPILLASNSDRLPWAPSAGEIEPFPKFGSPSFDSPTLVAQAGTPAWSVDPYHLYIAFVIDTTISMGPYIEQTLDISRELYERIENEGLEDKVSLAVVAFRSSTEASPGIEYTTRIVSDFRNASEGSSFISALNRVREAKRSTHSFNEDSFAGMESAIYDLSWPEETQDGKIIILISDAGPLPASDQFRSTNHTPSSLAGLAKSKGINLIPIHIKTGAGRRTHATAENAYRNMSASANREGDAYIDIDGGGTADWTSDTFGTVADTIIQNLEDQILQLARGPAASQTPSNTQNYGQRQTGGGTGGTGGGGGGGAGGGGASGGGGGAGGGNSAADEFVENITSLYPPSSLTGDASQGTIPDNATNTGPNNATNTGQATGDSQTAQLTDSGKSANVSRFGAPSGSGGLRNQPIKSDRPNSDDPSVTKAAEIGQKIGLSIRLNYLGAVNDVKAPQIIKSWIADKDLTALAGESEEAREVPTVEVAVLLTKNQLSSLSSQLKVIMEQADRNLDSQSRDFFQSILSASAQIANDPQAFSLKPETKLGDLGVMGEFLEDLPYRSVIMGKTEQDWYNMSYVEQDNFIRVIKSKVDLYAQYDLDVKNWARFDLENQGDWLYRVPLTMLP